MMHAKSEMTSLQLLTLFQVCAYVSYLSAQNCEILLIFYGSKSTLLFSMDTISKEYSGYTNNTLWCNEYCAVFLNRRRSR